MQLLCKQGVNTSDSWLSPNN